MAQRLSVASTSTSTSYSSSSSANHATYIVLHREGELGELEDAPTPSGGKGALGAGAATAGEQGQNRRAHWVRKEVALRVDMRDAVKERERRAVRSEEEQRLSEEQLREQEEQRRSYKATKGPPTAPTTTSKGHSRIRSFFSASSSSSKPSLKDSISAPRAASPTNLSSSRPSSPIHRPSPPPSAPEPRPRPSHSHSISSPHAVPPPPSTSAPPTVKFAPAPSPSSSRSPSPVQPKPLSRRPSLPNLGARSRDDREREDTAESTKSGAAGGKMGGWLKRTLRSSPSSSLSPPTSTSPSPTLVQSPSFSSSSASSLLSTPHGSPTLSIHLPPPSRHQGQPGIKRRPSIPETAFKALSSFLLARRESTEDGTGMKKRRSFLRDKAEGGEALSDEELRSWRKKGEGEMEVLDKEDGEGEQGEETEEEVRRLRRGPSVRRDQALANDREGKRSGSRGSRRSRSPEQSTDSLTPLATPTDSIPRFRFPFGLSLDCAPTPSTTVPPSPTTISLPDDIALSFLAASGYLELTARAAEATSPVAPAARPRSTPPREAVATAIPLVPVAPARPPPRPRRTTSTRRPSAAPSSSSFDSLPSLAFTPPPPPPTLNGGLLPPPRPSPSAIRMRRGDSAPSLSNAVGQNFSATSALGSSTASGSAAEMKKSTSGSGGGRRIISSEAWGQVSLSAQTAGRSRRERKKSGAGELGRWDGKQGGGREEEERKRLESGTLGSSQRRSGRKGSAMGGEGCMSRDGRDRDEKSRGILPTPPPSPPV